MDDGAGFHDPEVTCPHCFQEPCLLQQGLHRSIAEYYERELCHDDGSPIFPNNKQIRFRLYKHVTAWIHGFLGKGVRIEIPSCVQDEIIEMAPEDDHVYVGFRFGRAIDFDGKENVQPDNKIPGDRPCKRMKTSTPENIDSDKSNPK